MEVILLERVQNLGDLGEQVTVKAGYGRNYLVPQGMAVPATKANQAMFEERRAELERKAEEKTAAAQGRRDAVDGKEITITTNASAEGKLYGSVGTREIADALAEEGYAVSKGEIILSEGVIRQVGEYEIPLVFHPSVEAVIKLTIQGEGESEE